MTVGIDCTRQDRAQCGSVHNTLTGSLTTVIGTFYCCEKIIIVILLVVSSGYGRFGNVRENLQLSKQHFTPFVLYKEGAVDDMIRGLASQSSQKFDRFFTKEVRATLT